MYELGKNGYVTEVSLPNKEVSSAFPAVKDPINMVLSPNGNKLYILKKANRGENISVFDLSTESQINALPAPIGANQMLISKNGKELYVTVNVNNAGNLQIINTSS